LFRKSPTLSRRIKLNINLTQKYAKIFGGPKCFVLLCEVFKFLNEVKNKNNFYEALSFLLFAIRVFGGNHINPSTVKELNMNQKLTEPKLV